VSLVPNSLAKTSVLLKKKSILIVVKGNIVETEAFLEQFCSVSVVPMHT